MKSPNVNVISLLLCYFILLYHYVQDDSCKYLLCKCKVKLNDQSINQSKRVQNGTERKGTENWFTLGGCIA